MKYTLNACLFLLLPVLLLPACFGGSWSDEERRQFEQNCLSSGSVSDLVVRFRGFQNLPFDSVQVHEIRNGAPVDSFCIALQPEFARRPDARERFASLGRPLQLSSQYRFTVPGEKPYLLSDMRMTTWPQYTMFSEGWGCVMARYTIDGVLFEKNPNPTFTRRD